MTHTIYIPEIRTHANKGAPSNPRTTITLNTDTRTVQFSSSNRHTVQYGAIKFLEALRPLFNASFPSPVGPPIRVQGLYREEHDNG